MQLLKFRQYTPENWKSLIFYGGLFLLLGGLLVWKLGSLLPGYSQAEQLTFQAITNLKELLHGLLANPFYVPFLLTAKAIMYAGPGIEATRLAAVAGGFITLIAFALVLRQWHDRTTTLLGTLLFGTSAWFLHVSRSGTPEILLFGVFLLAAVGYWLRKTNHWLPLLLSFLVAIGLLYVPGMIWFILAGIIWQWRTIDRILKKHLGIVSIGSVLLIAGLAPLGWTLSKHHELIRPWLGLPASWPAPLEMAENLVKIPYHLLIHGQTNPTMWLGNAAILDVFTLVMFILGVYLYLKRFRLIRTSLFVVIFTVMALLMTIGSPVITFTVIMPFIYLMVAGGISQLIAQWFAVFPRNPIAGNVGRVLIAIALIISCSYQLTHYFIGWPKATATYTVFTVQKP